jgi:hypothetical protein
MPLKTKPSKVLIPKPDFDLYPLPPEELSHPSEIAL